MGPIGNDYERMRRKYLDGIETLKRKLEVLDDLEAEAKLEAATNNGRPVPPGTAPVVRFEVLNVVSPSTKYKDASLTAAVIDAINQLGKDHGVTPPEVRDYVLSNGLQSTSKHILNTIATVIARQLERGAIKDQVINGKRKYFPAGVILRAN